MKLFINKLSVYILILICAPILVLANGLPPKPSPSQVNDVAWTEVGSKVPYVGKNGKTIDCKVKFADLDYVGLKFVGEATCVAANNDSEARKACKASGLWINPGNPQYQKIIAGTRDSNPEGYYYCAKPNMRNKKVFACKNVAPKESIYLDTDRNVVFKWEPSAGTDGDCFCGQQGNASSFRECAQELPVFADQCQPKGFTTASLSEINAMTDEKARDLALCSIACKCQDGRIFPIGSVAEKCKEPPMPPPVEPTNVAATVDAPRPPPPTAAPVEDTLDANLKTCVDTWKENANKCKVASEEAKKECKGEDKTKKEAQDETAKVVDAANKAYVSSKTGSGAQQECFTGGVIASFANDLLNQKSDVCESSSTACTSACNIEDLNKERQRCHGILTDVVRTRYGGDEPPDSNRNSNYFTEGERVVNEVTTQGNAICGEINKNEKSMISSALEGVGKSMAASMTCMCKLSSGATGPCDKIVPPSNCTSNPDLPGCKQYGAIGVCTPGSTYDAKLCSCQLNPKGAGCPDGEKSGGLSNFATGGDLKGATGDFAVANPVSDLKPGPADLGGLKPEDGPASNLKLEPSKGGNSPSVGGGGGPSGGPGGGEPAAEPGAEEEKSGLSGLFGAAKTFVSNAFNSKKASGNGNLKGDPKSKFDASKFRPVRGVAGKSGVGSRNQDIWRMVNTCLYSETCSSNSNSFLESPLKHK
ncbi:hypothetical protein K2P97_08730 [bacterium]|nr:hypothetical protein [bacterium]